ncbi:excinuclease ABC subunit UvrA, partial [Bifidobacterium pullorum subsp. saeculare]|nr:excinuclease ABC subunit UvrA [Bifidobacterium pullorum subsp. saeculare]
SYNTGSLRCPTCDGTGQISLDVQFLPDVDIPCPDCGGARYGREAYDIKLAGDISLPELLSYTVDQASEVLAETTLRTVKSKLRILHDLGLGYLTLGEATPALSGGEAQRLKLASELTRKQNDALFVFDEPTIGLHPLDVEVLLGVLQRLIDN